MYDNRIELNNGVRIPQLGLGTWFIVNADVDFEISKEDMEVLKDFRKIESYGASSAFPVYGGKL